jgi:hypothetical protein
VNEINVRGEIGCEELKGNEKEKKRKGKMKG